MKIYSPDAVDYRFWLLPPDRKKKNVTDLIESAIFTSTEDGIVDTVSLRAKNEKFDGTWIKCTLSDRHFEKSPSDRVLLFIMRKKMLESN